MYWNDNGSGMMNGSGYAIFGLFMMFIFFMVIAWIFATIFGRSSMMGHDHGRHSHGKNTSPALEHLHMRLAKGEISPEEYAILKEHLLK